MKTLRSYVLDEWHEAADGFAELVDPTTEEPIARASSAGIDFAAVRDLMSSGAMLAAAEQHAGPLPGLHP